MDYDFRKLHIQHGNTDYPEKHNAAMQALETMGNDVIRLRSEAASDRLLAEQYACYPVDKKIPGTNDYSGLHYRQHTYSLQNGEHYTTQYIAAVTAIVISQRNIIENAHFNMKLSERLRKLEEE